MPHPPGQRAMILAVIPMRVIVNMICNVNMRQNMMGSHAVICEDKIPFDLVGSGCGDLSLTGHEADADIHEHDNA